MDALVEPVDDWRRQIWNGWNAWRALTEGQRGFFTPRPPTALLGPQPPAAASFYDTAPLKATLERLVDFDRINAGVTRLTVSAVNVETGNFEAFDNQPRPLAQAHPRRARDGLRRAAAGLSRRWPSRIRARSSASRAQRRAARRCTTTGTAASSPTRR